MNNQSSFDKVWRAIESLTGKHIAHLHDESKGYAFRYFQGNRYEDTFEEGVWDLADFSLINDLAGLGADNTSKL